MVVADAVVLSVAQFCLVCSLLLPPSSSHNSCLVLNDALMYATPSIE